MKQVNIRMPVWMADQLAARADLTGETQASIVRLALQLLMMASWDARPALFSMGLTEAQVELLSQSLGAPE